MEEDNVSDSALHEFARKYGTTTRIGDWSDFASGALSGVFSAVNAGLAEDEREQQEKKEKEDAAEKARVLITASIAADASATTASAQARWSTQMGRSSAAADASAALVAAAAQDAAGAKLHASQVPARVAVAKKALADATAKQRETKGKPGEVFAKCLVDAAQVTFNKASGLKIIEQTSNGVGSDGPKKESGNFWTDPLVGPVPGWGVVAGGAGLGAILWRVLRGKWGF